MAAKDTYNIAGAADKPAIAELLDKEKLESIQDRIGKATGLAFVTVDYMGIPVTKLSCFCDFCKGVRSEEETCAVCMKSDAFGALQAAITHHPFVYFCPCGLLEVAIPIEADGAFLGGFIGGQVICEDAPEDVLHLSTVFEQKAPFLSSERMVEAFKRAKHYPYAQYMDVVNLIHLVIKQLFEDVSIESHTVSDLGRRITGIEGELSLLREKMEGLEGQLGDLAGQGFNYQAGQKQNAADAPSPDLNGIEVINGNIDAAAGTVKNETAEGQRKSSVYSKVDVDNDYSLILKYISGIVESNDYRRVYKESIEVARQIMEASQGINERTADILHTIKVRILSRYFEDPFGDTTISDKFSINVNFLDDPIMVEMWICNFLDFIYKYRFVKRYSSVKLVFEYIDEHIKEYINMLSIVEHCHLSQQYLLRLFKDQMKMSALEYIQIRKMNLAKWYLYFEEFSTIDVASKLGFGDVGYFSKVFKKYENMTPHQYKLSVKKAVKA